jgi:hypothetical protein
MYKITIKGEAFTEHQNLEELDGIDCQDEFSEYFGDDEQLLIDKGVNNGYLSFEYSGGKLWSVTTYDSPVELTQNELDIIGDYTQGQWSDGIGEGFEQFPCMEDDNEKEVYVSPWHSNQVLTVTQKLKQ